MLAAAAMASPLAGCSGVFYQPDRMMYYPPEMNSLKREDIYFASLDGTRLHAWLIRAVGTAHAKGTIILFHGNAENISSHYLSLAWLTRQGYDLFAFDYRGYGESLGQPDQAGTYNDGLAALNKAWQLHSSGHGGQFVVYGQSLGGIIALRSFLDFEHQDATALLVMDSTFLSYRDCAQSWMARRWLTWPFSPLARILVSDAYATKDLLPKLHTRLLVIHDKLDPVVPYINGRELYDRAPGGNKQFWELDEGRHVGVFWTEKMEYRTRFLELLTELI